MSRALMCLWAAGAAVLVWTGSAAAGEAPAAPPAIALADLAWAKRVARPVPLSYTESALCYDTKTRQFVLWGGHIGGRVWATGPEGELTHLYEPLTNAWKDAKPATMPEGACCVRDIVFDQRLGKTLIFGGHSGAHGWQWRRPLTQRRSMPWAYDAEKDEWTALRPLDQPEIRPYRGAAYDPYHEVTLIVGGEGYGGGTVCYDSYTNTWHRLRPPKDLSGPDDAYNRMFPALAWSPAHRKFVLFGGSKKNDTWTFDIEANAWQRVEATDEPTPERRVGVYDTVNEALLLFGHTAEDTKHVNTWSFDLARRAWTLLAPETKPGPYEGNRYIAAYSPHHNVTLFKQEDNRREEFWLFRYRNAARKPDAPPDAPTAVEVVAAAGKADLTWTPVPGAAGYLVHRAVGEVPWKLTFEKLTGHALREPRFADPGLQAGKIHFYRVTAVDEKARESASSPLARTQPRVPAEPIVSVLSATQAEVRWSASPEKDVTGYNLYRAEAEGLVSQGASVVNRRPPAKPLAWVRLNAEKPLAATTYTDSAISLDGARDFGYAYLVKAVNALGVESGPSPFALTIPSNLMGPSAAGERDGTLTVTWQVNPEKNVAGYNVYTYGRDGKAEKLNAEPVKDPRYVHKFAASRLMRLVVVAVNALGQEGVPSHAFWGWWELSQRG